MHALKFAILTLSLLGVVAPAWADDSDRSMRHDPYARYRARQVNRPTHVEHRPKLIRAEPLIRQRPEYRNASMAPAPAEVRATVQPTVAATLRGNATVVVDPPAIRVDRHRYQDIGQARVVRNPLLLPEPVIVRDRIIEPARVVQPVRVVETVRVIEPVRSVRHDAFLLGLRHREARSRAFIRIGSGFEHHVWRSPIHRGHHHSHGHWHGHGHHHHRHTHLCRHPSSSIILHFEF